MKLWDGRNKSGGWQWSDIGGPVRGDTIVQVYEPLTGNIVADENDRNSKTLDSRGKNEVHICKSIVHGN